jgi:predicted nucleotidyltransferase component of viral defense system
LISQAYITEWSNRVAWPDPVQVEQDLILSRLIVEIANDDFLGAALAFRGGTCLHKLHLPHALRYSEDLDYVRTDEDPKLGKIFAALRAITEAIGLEEHRRKFPDQSSDMGTIWFDARPESGSGLIRIKIESNVAEARPFQPHRLAPFELESGWWSGQAEVRVVQLGDLLGTKLRALYQRRKGRDLFDLWAALTQLDVDAEATISALDHYQAIAGKLAFTYPELRDNLRQKLTNAVFLQDLDALVATPPEAYEAEDAAALILARLGTLLRNPPTSG